MLTAVLAACACLNLLVLDAQDEGTGEAREKVVIVCSDMYTSALDTAFAEIHRAYPDLAGKVEFALVPAYEVRAVEPANDAASVKERGEGDPPPPGGGVACGTGGAPAAITQASLVIVDCLSRENVRRLAGELKRLNSAGVVLLAVNDNELCRKENEAMGLRYDPAVRSYFSARGRANMRNMLLLALQKYRGVLEGIVIPPAVPAPDFGIYHPRAPEPRCFETIEEYLRWYESSTCFMPSAPCVGILFFPTNYNTGQLAEVDALVEALETRELNVFPTFGYPDDRLLQKYYAPEKRPRNLACLVSLTMKFANSDACVPILRDLGLPVINLVSVQATESDWLASKQGLTVGEVPWQIAVPEMSGLVQHTAVGARRLGGGESGPASGKVIERSPIRERIERTVARAKSWITLQQKPRGEKRVAFVYYNYPPGKHRIGASYLNVFRSMEVILNRLKEAGYALGPDPTDEKTLLSEALDHGRNVSTSAPGELEKLVATGKCVLLPLATYETWFRETPDEFQEFVCRRWGRPADAKLMTWTDDTGKYFVIPCVRRGNVLLVPQGLRGWSEEGHEKLYHDQTLPPPHQYVAMYLWLAREFRADAVVHVGRHSTHEFLSGKELALSGADAPEVLIGAFPNLYIYVVDGLGEGIIAKRRGTAVIIDHNIPPLKRCGNYGRLAEIIDLDIARMAAAPQNPVLAEMLADRILDLAKQEGLDKEIADWSEDKHHNIHELLDYVRELQEKTSPCGMHTFGTCASGEMLSSTAKIIAEAGGRGRVPAGSSSPPDSPRNDPEGQPVPRAGSGPASGESAADAEVARCAALLAASADAELDSLVAGLDGKFIRPGPGNDPVRCLEALPTGKNFYSFDPRKIPRTPCWELGSRLAEEAVETYRAKNGGKYPDKMAFNVWCVEVVRHEGVVESQILRLLGIRPVWDAQDRVVDLQLIPREELGRPRVDVVITISGIYRDAFGALVVMLDRAARMAARADEEDNRVRAGLILRRDRFVAAGRDGADAEKLASARIFGPPPGEYGTKVSDVVSDSARWEGDREVADVYLNRMCHAYGDGFWDLESRAAFESALSGAQMAFHSRSSNVYGVLDNDDSFQYAGGLICAIRAIDGESPPLVVTNLQDPRRPQLQHINEYLGSETRSRYFNPEWIRSMMAEGYAGGKEITEFAEYLWGWQVTVPDAVDESKWAAAYDTYVADVHNLGMNEFFEKNNPWARQVFAAQLLEVERKGYWPSASQATLDHLAEVYAKDVDAHGIACAGITCDNPELAAAVIERLRDRAPALAGTLRRRVEEATKRSIEELTGSVKSERSAIRTELQRTRTAPRPVAASAVRTVRGLALRPVVDAVRQPADAFPARPGAGMGFMLSLSLVSLAVLSGFCKSLLDAAVALRIPVRPLTWLWSIFIHGAALALAGSAVLGPELGRTDTDPRPFSVGLARLDERPTMIATPLQVPPDLAIEAFEPLEEPPELPDPPEPDIEPARCLVEKPDSRPLRDPLESRADRSARAEVIMPKTKHADRPAEPPSVSTGEVSAQGEAESSCEARLDVQYNVPPAYPLIARRKGWEGAVLLEAHVAPDGSCLGVEVVESSGYAVLDSAAREAALGWRFVPASHDGRPVEVTTRFRVVFKLTSQGSSASAAARPGS